ncbi:MAG: hypothetical protein CSA10_00065 [Cardiobacteriales bacterium]|nr:MAG: hypothetical protein CSA10_00065 [Cardiobacteriales bacterium]
MRDFMNTMRATGVLELKEMGGQKPYTMKDKQRFANKLHKLLR